MIRKIISGGQTGADRGALEAAVMYGFPYGGFIPPGRKAEDGRVPNGYLMTECSAGGYPGRTKANVAASCGTVLFEWAENSPGSRLTKRFCAEVGKPVLVFGSEQRHNPSEEMARLISVWAQVRGIAVLNFAGTRESKANGLQIKVREVAAEVIHFAMSCQGCGGTGCSLRELRRTDEVYSSRLRCAMCNSTGTMAQ